MSAARRPYLKSLEGVRAYAFLMVFLVHFSGFKWTLTGRSLLVYPWLILLQLSFVAVPIFFALSGYLITGILFDSLGRDGYFSVFYLRRAMRVFPLYYLVIALGAVLAVCTGAHFTRAHLLYLVYLHNWIPDQSAIRWARYVHMSHLWSLAVEEQYYLLWPVVVWILRGRRQLLGFCYTAVGLACVARLLFPLLHMTVFQAYQSTLFRCDAIMLGSALALHERGPMRTLARLTKPAGMAVAGGVATMVVRALLAGQALPYDRFGVAVIMPLLAVTGAGIVVLAIEPGNAISYLSERTWAVALGKLSYSLYLLHEFLVPPWERAVVPMLTMHLGARVGRLAAMALAFWLIYVASLLTYRFVELPGIRMKGRFRYRRRNGLVPERGPMAFLMKVTI